MIYLILLGIVMFLGLSALVFGIAMRNGGVDDSSPTLSNRIVIALGAPYFLVLGLVALALNAASIGNELDDFTWTDLKWALVQGFRFVVLGKPVVDE